MGGGGGEDGQPKNSSGEEGVKIGPSPDCDYAVLQQNYEPNLGGSNSVSLCSLSCLSHFTYLKSRTIKEYSYTRPHPLPGIQGQGENML